MSEFDSIKRFITIILMIIISCFSAFVFANLMYMLKTQNIIIECFFHIFIIYFLIDLLITLQDENGMYFPEYYCKTHYKTTRIIYFQ